VSYKVIVSPDAFDGLKQIDGDTLRQLAPCIFASLNELGSDPIKHGERPLVPYPVAGQIFYFQCRVDGVNYNLAAVFCYDETETEIHILSVGYRRAIM
jgi:hypothetical protein